MNGDNTPSIDWDGELQALMEASGIDPGYAERPPWTTRARRRIHHARTTLLAIAITGAGMWWVAHSGAPAAATGPLCGWLACWNGYWIWIGSGRPDFAAITATAKDLGSRGFRAGTRFVFRKSRPARARWRAWQAARARTRVAAQAAN